MSLSRRTALSVFSTAAAVSVLAACSSGSDDSGTSGSTGGTTDDSGGKFPATVAHKYGTTTIKQKPTRIVTVGLVEQDMVIAIWSDLKQSDYRKLSQLAPTVAPPKGFVDYGAPWDVMTQMVASAMGLKSKGATIVRDVKATFTAARKKHPEFKGKTAMVLGIYDGLFPYAESDPRNRVQQELGFVYPAKFKDLKATSISSERTKEFDFDVVAWVDSESSVVKETGGLLKQTTAYKEGREIYVPNTIPGTSKPSTYAAAFSMVTPLSLPWMLERYVPQLAAAVDGKTSTEVPVVKV